MWKGVLPSDGTPARINVLDGLSRMTLDVIGLAGMAAVTIFVVSG